MLLVVCKGNVSGRRHAGWHLIRLHLKTLEELHTTSKGPEVTGVEEAFQLVMLRSNAYRGESHGVAPPASGVLGVASLGGGFG